jgi:hypothetical protein
MPRGYILKDVGFEVVLSNYYTFILLQLIFFPFSMFAVGYLIEVFSIVTPLLHMFDFFRLSPFSLLIPLQFS